MCKEAFSLIELMIVITIIGILAAVAVPSYQQYIVQAKISELVTMAAPAKKAVEEYISINGDIPACGTNGAINATVVGVQNITSTGNVYNLRWNHNCTIEVIGDSAKLGINADQSKYISLAFCPQYANGVIQWKCLFYYNHVDVVKYQPSYCSEIWSTTNCDG